MSDDQQQERECLNCGMRVAVSVSRHEFILPDAACPKCDDALFLQTDGSVLTGDIAHQRESVPEALEKLDRLLIEGVHGYFESVRLIVGSGLIRDEVHGHLQYLQSRQDIRHWSAEGKNQGAVLVRIRQS